MKKLNLLFTLLFALILLTGYSFAQSSDQPLLIISQNMVTMSDVGKVNRIGDSIFVPILKELVDEGMLYSFGNFNHTWGDEWNVNYWYTAKDMVTFDKFWDEYVKRVTTRHPDAWPIIIKYFQAHKDNIYTIRGQYPAPKRK